VSYAEATSTLYFYNSELSTRRCPVHDNISQKGIYCYWGAARSLVQPTSRCILFDGENISFDASLVIYINSTNIPPIMKINRIYEHQNLLFL
jgi:hypothetical protein